MHFYWVKVTRVTCCVLLLAGYSLHMLMSEESSPPFISHVGCIQSHVYDMCHNNSVDGVAPRSLSRCSCEDIGSFHLLDYSFAETFAES